MGALRTSNVVQNDPSKAAYHAGLFEHAPAIAFRCDEMMQLVWLVDISRLRV